jgi:hypothetical protein
MYINGVLLKFSLYISNDSKAGVYEEVSQTSGTFRNHTSESNTYML